MSNILELSNFCKIQGTNITVTVERAIDDVLVVSCTVLNKIFRGVLLDSSKKNWPYGIAMQNIDNMSGEACTKLTGFCEGKDAGLSILNYRNTYNQDCIKEEQREPLKIGTSKKTVLKDKNFRSRPVRLRPRQVVCSKCKSICNEKSEHVGRVEPKQTASKEITAAGNSDNDDDDDVDDTASLAAIDNVDDLESKNRLSPIIKISFNNPEGKGTVVKIDPKKGVFHRSVSMGDLKHLNSTEAHIKIKKAIKKAKHRHKHKRKKRHKHDLYLENKNVDNDVSSVVCMTKARVNLKRLPDSQLSTFSSAALGDVGNYNSSESDDAEDINDDYDAINNDDDVSNSSYDSSFSYPLSSRSSTMTEDSLGISERGASDFDEVKRVKPLMMRIQSQSVGKCVTPNGKTMSVGDIVWGKIRGCPWWPGRILAISESVRDNGMIVRQQAHVAWFASTTSSNMSCSEIVAFLDNFNHRFNKKKKGAYKDAVRQATMAAQSNLSDLTVVDGVS